MKTFNLITLELLEKAGNDLDLNQIDFEEGLIIDRETDERRWLVECLLSRKTEEFFLKKKEKKEEMVAQVRITKPTNPKASLVVNVESVNLIGEQDMNVIFSGHMVNREREQVETMLQELIEEGYQGQSLLNKFKEKNQESIM